MANPADLFYTKDHEWAKIEGDVATVGITDYAQHSLGDIVYVELPRVGAEVKEHSSIGVVESVKAVSELFNPVTGEVVEINPLLETDPSAVNRDAFGEGWMYKVKLPNGTPSGLLSADEYEKLTAEQMLDACVESAELMAYDAEGPDPTVVTASFPGNEPFDDERNGQCLTVRGSQHVRRLVRLRKLTTQLRYASDHLPNA